MKNSIPLRVIYGRMTEAAGNNELNSAAREMSTEVLRLVISLEGLESIIEKRDPTITEAAHKLRVSQAAKKLTQRAADTLDKINDYSHDGLNRLSDRIDEVAGLRPNEYAGEIRTAVRALKPDERRNVLKRALDSGDAATVAALVDAPSVVTGIEPEFAGAMREGFISKRAPREIEARDLLLETLSLAVKSVGTVKSVASTAADEKGVQKIIREQQAADDARRNFEQA